MCLSRPVWPAFQNLNLGMSANSEMEAFHSFRNSFAPKFANEHRPP